MSSRELPITVEDGLLAGPLPRHHDDRFDRVPIARATRRGLVLFSVSRRFADDVVRVL